MERTPLRARAISASGCGPGASGPAQPASYRFPAGQSGAPLSRLASSFTPSPRHGGHQATGGDNAGPGYRLVQVTWPPDLPGHRGSLARGASTCSALRLPWVEFPRVLQQPGFVGWVSRLTGGAPESVHGNLARLRSSSGPSVTPRQSRAQVGMEQARSASTLGQ